MTEKSPESPLKVIEPHALDEFTPADLEKLRSGLRVHCCECAHWRDTSPPDSISSPEIDGSANSDRFGECRLYSAHPNQGRMFDWGRTFAGDFCSQGIHVIDFIRQKARLESTSRGLSRLPAELTKRVLFHLNEASQDEE